MDFGITQKPISQLTTRARPCLCLAQACWPEQNVLSICHLQKSNKESPRMMKLVIELRSHIYPQLYLIYTGNLTRLQCSLLPVSNSWEVHTRRPGSRDENNSMHLLDWIYYKRLSTYLWTRSCCTFYFSLVQWFPDVNVQFLSLKVSFDLSIAAATIGMLAS